jgi:RNA polymerase sigma-70 factor, ECF subfamily
MSLHGETPPPDDPARLRTLFERMRAGDASALESLFRSEYARLCVFADAIVHAPDVAEEIVQRVFVAIWANRGNAPPPDNVRAYLARAVRNHALNHIARLRTEKRHVARVLAESRHATVDAADALDALERAEAADVVGAALETLPTRCRQVMALRWQHGLKHREIAETLGISIKAVEQHLARGLRALRDRFGGRA